jgi:excisionase family DNA binding protein
MNSDNFRRWLQKQSLRLKQLGERGELDLSDYEEAAEIVQEARQRALDLHLAEVHEAGAIRSGPLSVELARSTLSRMIQALPDPDQRSSDGPLSVEQVAVRLGVSKGKVYELCRSRVLPHDRVGTRIVITTEQLKAYQQANRSPVAGPTFRHL